MSPFLWLVPTAALIMALFPMPYGYYQLLRVLIFLIAIFLASTSFKARRDVWVWGFAAMAIIYNPLFPLSLGREIWSVVNVATIVMLLMHWRIMGSAAAVDGNEA
jgi:hypothetical protein